MTRYPAVFAAVLALAGCSSTTQRPEHPGDVAVHAGLEQISRRAADEDSAWHQERISLALRDARGRAIENDSLGVEVNGVPLVLDVVQGYFFRAPFYRLPDNALLRLHPDSAYRVAVLWPDGRRLPAGTIRTPRRTDAGQVDVALRRDGGLRVRWRGLAEPARLEVFVSFGTRDSTGARMHGTALPGLADGRGRTVGAGSGAVVVPAASLAPRAEGEAYVVRVVLTKVAEARVPAPFRDESSLWAQRRVEVEMALP